MAWIKAFLSFLLALAIILLGILLTLRNSGVVSVNLEFWQSPELSLGMLMVVCVLIGCLLGIAMNSVWLIKMKRKSQKLQKQLDQTIKRLEQLQ